VFIKMFSRPYWRSTVPKTEKMNADPDSTLVKQMTSMLTHRRRAASESQVQTMSKEFRSDPCSNDLGPRSRSHKILPGGGASPVGDSRIATSDNSDILVSDFANEEERSKIPTKAGPASACIRSRSQARNQQPQQIDASCKNCNSCDKKFTLFNRKRQCQSCQNFFCNKCAPTGYFSRERLCIDCLSNHAKAKNFRPNSETMSSSTAHKRVLSDSSTRAESVDPEVAAEGKLNILDLDKEGVQLPWEFDAPAPQSIFRVRDREIAFNLCIADSKCSYYKTQLKPTKGCACHPQLKNQDGIQVVEFPLAGPAWCSSIRLDMQFTRTNDMYVCVRVSSRDTFFTGLVMVDVKQIQRSLSEGAITFVDDLCVTCTNVSNPGDPNDSITVLGSFAWKLYNDSRDGAKFLGGDAMASPLPSPENLGLRSNVETVRTVLQKSRGKLLDELDHAVRDERTFLDQFNKFEKELQCRTNSMAGANESIETGSDSGEPPAHLKLSTDELSTTDLKLAKDAAWCQKEQMTYQRRRLAMLADQTETLKALVETVNHASAKRSLESGVPCAERFHLNIPCPSCGLSIQCNLS